MQFKKGRDFCVQIFERHLDLEHLAAFEGKNGPIKGNEN